jgi:hypothetical protein
MTHRILAAVASLLLLSPAVLEALPGDIVIRGVTTTQAGAVILPGVEVTVMSIDSGRPAATIVSDGAGRFVVPGLPVGRYRVVGRLAGFQPATVEAGALSAGQEVEARLDLALAGVAESVKVVGEAGTATLEPAATRNAMQGAMADLLPVSGDGLRSLLPILPGVVRAPDGRISLKGARPTQGAMQFDQASGSDPSTGNFGIELPTDAIASIGFAPNPYAAENGRFSSSIVRLETRSGGDRWRATANTFIPIPCLTLCDGKSMGVRSYNPRAWIGGPLVKERLFLSQSLEFKLNKVRVPSLQAPDNLIEAYTYDVFTRLDANLGSRHALTASVALFPRDIHYVNLNTFNPGPVTANLRLRGYSIGVSDTSTLAPTLVATFSVNASRFHTTVDGQGTDDMEITPGGNQGHYFNTQDRRTQAYQAAGSITTARSSAWGEHLLKTGFDVLQSSYTGTSLSRSVLVRREDGTLSQRIDFGATTMTQEVSGTDVAVFAQDQWRIGGRLRIEPGIRLDRDGVLAATTVSPRVSVVLSLRPDAASVVSGGTGVFFERTPLNVGAFRSFEAATVTAFAADGVTPADRPTTFTHAVSPLSVPRATIWNLEYDHRIGRQVFLKLNHLRRSGSHEFIVSPVSAGGASELRLASNGNSRYEETEVTVRAGASDERHVALTYVRSVSSANLNAYDLYFGNLRTPIVRPDQYSRAPVDVPHRVVARAVIPMPGHWTLSPMVEVRSGFPYSLVDENQEFVGARNAGGRFPLHYTLDVNLIRQVKIKGRDLTIGIRGWHLLNTFMPRDVQANVDSPAFGTFYNTIPRRIIFVFQLTGMSGQLAK